MTPAGTCTSPAQRSQRLQGSKDSGNLGLSDAWGVPAGRKASNMKQGRTKATQGAAGAEDAGALVDGKQVSQVLELIAEAFRTDRIIMPRGKSRGELRRLQAAVAARDREIGRLRACIGQDRRAAKSDEPRGMVNVLRKRRA